MDTPTNNRRAHQKPSKLQRIVIVEEDGSETILQITKNLHFILAFMEAGPEDVGKEKGCEIIIHGNGACVGEMFFMTGENYPELLHYASRRSQLKVMTKLRENLKAAVSGENADGGGDDMMSDFLRNVKPGGSA